MPLRLGVGIGVPFGGNVFSPERLFSVAGSRGFFYDFSDYSTQFTDTAGTTPITGTGQSLARVNDKSGLGNHATQGTAGSRPTTGRRPRRGRVNTLLYSEEVSQWGLTKGGVASVPTVNALSATAFQTIPDGGNGAAAGKGFTCTGLFYDGTSLWVGNLGVDQPGNAQQPPQIIKVSLDGATLQSAVTIAQQPQGVIALGDNLYYAQNGLGKVYRLAKDGSGETEFASLAGANGLATDGRTIWVGAGTSVYPLSLSGSVGSPFDVGVVVDHLHYDAERNWLWVTSGANGAAGVVTIYSFGTGTVLKRYTLSEGLALEGLTIVGSSILIASDGYYHQTDVVPTGRKVNEIQTYPAYPIVGGIIGSYLADYVKFALNGGATSADFSQIQQNSAVAGSRVGSVYLWTADSSPKNIALNIADTGGNTQQIKAVTGVPTRFSTARTTYTGPAETLGLRLRGAAGTADSAEVFVWGAQVEAGSVPTGYQRVGATFFDVVEEGQQTIQYVRVQADDFLQTAAIDFSNSDKVTVIAGLRKLSDAANGIIVELTADFNANNGAFSLRVPGPGQWGFSSKGTAGALPVSAASFAAPDTAVLVGIGDISGDSAILQRNGTQIAQAVTDQGTGNFSNAVVYIGARAGGGAFLDAEVSWMLVINRILTASEIAQCAALANARTGAF